MKAIHLMFQRYYRTSLFVNGTRMSVGSPKKQNRQGVARMAKNRTKRVLLEASEHICYEIWMLHDLGCALATRLTGIGPIHNAFINSFAVHVRNLVDFLYEHKGKVKVDVILAEHYFPSSQDWSEIRPVQSDKLKTAKIRCDKQVAHLTYTRHKKEPWDFITIVRELQVPLTTFVNNIDISLLGDNYNSISHYFTETGK